jgi:hypothetical protein
MASVKPAELGRFLSDWKEQQPLWAITRIDLAHERRRGRNENRYDVTLVLSAIYVDQR